MRGLWLEGGRLTLRDDLPAPAPAAGECRVRVLRAGICATDLALARGYMGFAGVPGHEFVGEALDGPLAGRRVVGEINAACGRCATCARGDGGHCPHRTVLGILGRPGAFAEQLALPAANLHPVPDGVGTDAATFTEPLAAAFQIAEQVPLRPGRRALVAGDGKLGLLCAFVLAEHGLKVILAGRHPKRRDLLPAGVAHAGDLLATEPPPGEAFELAVEATGDPQALSRLLPWMQPRGTVVLKTTCERPFAVDLSRVVVDELLLLGSRCGPFAPALQALARRTLPVDRLIASRYPLEHAADAFAHAARPGTLKVLLDVAGPGAG